jgi:nicotinamide phosphoribosyltransferase
VRYNPILDSDSYKLSHHLLYPHDVTNVYSYAESRGGEYPETMFFGLQPYIKRLVENPVTWLDLSEAEDFAKAHGEPFNRAGWEHIITEHGGCLPIEIKAVAEGSLVPTRNVLVTVENTDPACAWLTSYVETSLLRQVWYATTTATRLFNMKRRIKAAYDLSADDYVGLDFALLDFMSRGVTSYGANEIAGTSYLAMFKGSDSLPAVRYANHYYDCPMSGFSIPATEHSVTTSWGKDRSIERKRAYIDRVAPGSTIADVLDTWDCFREAREWVGLIPELRAKNLTLVGRPDSGNIRDVMPELLGIFAQGFGCSLNGRGYRVINGAKVLWGDGINEATHMDPFHCAMDMGISAQSVMTGSGGGIGQADLDRDTCKFAFKASAISCDRGQTWEGVAKDPITDPGKRSKMGRLGLMTGITPRRETQWQTVEQAGALYRPGTDQLHTIYNNGALFNMENLDRIRDRIDSQL